MHMFASTCGPAHRDGTCLHYPRAIEELRRRGYVRAGQQVAIVQSGRQPIWRSASTHTIQVRLVMSDVQGSSDDEVIMGDVTTRKKPKAPVKAADKGNADKAK